MESEESHECIRTAARDSKTERIKVSCLDIIVTMIGKSHITKSSTRKSERTIIMLATVPIS